MNTAIFSKFLAGLFAIVGIAICVEAYRLGFFSFGVPAAGMFPFMAGALLTIASGVAVLLPVEEEMRGEMVPVGQPLILMVAAVLYFLFFEILGVYVATGLYLIGTLLFVFRNSLITVTATLAAALVVIYLMFGLWLRTPLPQFPW